MVIRIILAAVMVSVSTLAHADKWEYGLFLYELGKSAKEHSYSFTTSDVKVIGSGETNVDANKLFCHRMGWDVSDGKAKGLTVMFDLLGQSGWEMASSDTNETSSGAHQFMHWFKRRID